jgi:hypothetical protein
MKNKNIKTVIIKGYGDFYGHNFKTEIIKETNENFTIKSNGIMINFDTNTGFASEREMQRNGYQLDINSISEGLLSENISVNGINKFGQICIS